MDGDEVDFGDGVRRVEVGVHVWPEAEPKRTGQGKRAGSRVEGQGEEGEFGKWQVERVSGKWQVAMSERMSELMSERART